MWTINDQYHEKRIVESPSVLQLKNYVESKNLKCQVTLQPCQHGFWDKPPIVQTGPPETSRWPRGLAGEIGCTGATGGCGPRFLESASRPVLKDRKTSITIKFEMLTEHAEQIQNHQFWLTNNYLGKTHPIWQTNPIYQYVKSTYGVYKKTGFDQVLSSMQILKPLMTAHQLAYKDDDWDEDLVDLRLYDSDVDCIDTYTYTEAVKLPISRVSLTLLTVDVEKNLPFLKKLLMSC